MNHYPLLCKYGWFEGVASFYDWQIQAAKKLQDTEEAASAL